MKEKYGLKAAKKKKNAACMKPEKLGYFLGFSKVHNAQCLKNPGNHGYKCKKPSHCRKCNKIKDDKSRGKWTCKQKCWLMKLDAQNLTGMQLMKHQLSVYFAFLSSFFCQKHLGLLVAG